MARILGLAFVLLLAVAHVGDSRGQVYARPLSMFRDYEPAWVGYALFGLLIGVGLALVRTAYRVSSWGDVLVYVSFSALLSYVALSPSLGELHLLSAFALMYGVFFYHAFRLYWGDQFRWFLAHMMVPSYLATSPGMSSYGIWQKSMIVYFLASLLIHETILAQGLPRSRPRGTKRMRLIVARKPTPTLRPLPAASPRGTFRRDRLASPESRESATPSAR